MKEEIGAALNTYSCLSISPSTAYITYSREFNRAGLLHVFQGSGMGARPDIIGKDTSPVARA